MNTLFIDSGIGGLTTLCTTIKQIPNLNFIYYADDKYSPYGNLNQSQIINRLICIINSQLKYNIGLIVIACNTATANAIDYLRKIYNIPIIGTEPAIKPAYSTGNSILVLATPSTTKQSRFSRLIKKYTCNIEIAPMPLLAKQIDNYFLFGDQFSKDEIDATLKYITYLSHNKSHIVLGCTHYVHLRKLIREQTGKQVLDGNDGVCKQIQKKLSIHMLSNKPKQKFIVSSKNVEISKKYRRIFTQTLAND